MDALRVGIIGVGNMGVAHADNIYEGKVKNMKLTALCDFDEAKRARAAERFPGIPIFSDFNELNIMRCCDAVIVATPHYSHAIIAIQALRAGLHVMVEKPISVYARQAEELCRAANESGKVFGIMFNQRTNPCYIEARKIIKSGQLGNLKRLNWIITNLYRTQAYYDSGSWRATWRGEGGGVLINQAPHNLDLAQWIFGMPKRLRAFCNIAKYHTIEVEDEATVYAEYENGATATFQVSTGEYPGTNRLEVAGDLGKLVVEDGKIKLWKLDKDESAVRFDSDLSLTDIPYTYEEIIPDGEETAHCGILEDFANAIMNGTPLLAPGVEGLNELEISNAAYLSAWKDKWVTIPCDRKEFERELDAHRKASEKINISASSKSDEIASTKWRIRW